MRGHASVSTQKSAAATVSPTSGALLQRQCACGQHTIAGGECEACRKHKMKPGSASKGNPPLSFGQPSQQSTRPTIDQRFRFNFMQVPAQSGWRANEIYRAYSGKSECSPTWFGETTPEIDSATGGFTGKLVVTYNEAELKDPCVRECVELHESVHVRDLTPVVKKIHDCDVAAGKDWDKKEKCNAMATHDLWEARERSECAAYQKSFTCLTLKVLDSSSPCSKPPHREEVQKHRGYEGCDMKNHCAGAGTPEAGIPKV